MVGGADKGAGDDACLVEEVVLDAYLELGGAVAELGQAGLSFAAAAFAVRALAENFADAPKLGIVGVGGVAALVAAVEHLGAHTQGVADAEDGYATQGQLAANPVDGGVAGGADEYLCFALEGLDDGFDEGGGFACARRTMDDGDLLCLDDALYGVLLAGVEPWEGEARKLSERGRVGTN